MGWIWLAAAVLVAAAAVGIWMAFQRPGFVAGLGAIVATAIFNAIAPAPLKRKTPEAEKIDHEAARRGQEAPNAIRRHPGEQH